MNLSIFYITYSWQRSQATKFHQILLQMLHEIYMTSPSSSFWSEPVCKAQRETKEIVKSHWKRKCKKLADNGHFPGNCVEQTSVTVRWKGGSTIKWFIRSSFGEKVIKPQAPDKCQTFDHTQMCCRNPIWLGNKSCMLIIYFDFIVQLGAVCALPSLSTPCYFHINNKMLL